MNNLPVKVNNGFFSRVRMFFLKIFGRNKNKYKEISENVETVNEVKIDSEQKREEFISEIGKTRKEEKIKDDIVDQVNENPELIDTMPLERLDQLEKIYDERIAKVKMENEMLRAKIENLRMKLNSNTNE